MADRDGEVWGVGEEIRRWLLIDMGVTFGGNGNILELDNGDNCTVLWNILKNYWIVSFKGANFMICELYINLKRWIVCWTPWIQFEFPSLMLPWRESYSFDQLKSERVVRWLYLCFTCRDREKCLGDMYYTRVDGCSLLVTLKTFFPLCSLPVNTNKSLPKVSESH